MDNVSTVICTSMNCQNKNCRYVIGLLHKLQACGHQFLDACRSMSAYTPLMCQINVRIHTTYVYPHIISIKLLLIRLHQHHLLISDMHNCKCSSYLKSYLGFHHWYGISTWVAMCCMLLLARVSALWYFRFNLQEQDSVTIIFVLFS